jgi:hypothetical protein
VKVAELSDDAVYIWGTNRLFVLTSRLTNPGGRKAPG